jgi:plasmid stabilization system protein ParE
MIFKVVFLDSAEQDLRELRHYLLRNFEKPGWQASYSKIKNSVSILKSLPFGGGVPEELDRLGLTQFRQIISGMNRIIYEVRQETVYIHLVCDTRKDLKMLLMQRLLH